MYFKDISWKIFYVDLRELKLFSSSSDFACIRKITLKLQFFFSRCHVLLKFSHNFHTIILNAITHIQSKTWLHLPIFQSSKANDYNAIRRSYKGIAFDPLYAYLLPKTLLIFSSIKYKIHERGCCIHTHTLKRRLVCWHSNLALGTI